MKRYTITISILFSLLVHILLVISLRSLNIQNNSKEHSRNILITLDKIELKQIHKKQKDIKPIPHPKQTIPPKRMISKKRNSFSNKILPKINPKKDPHHINSKGKRLKQKKSLKKIKKSYKNLNLLPNKSFLTALKNNKNNKNQAWSGTDRFSRVMQHYHQQWKDALKDKSGLTDIFFGKAIITIDKCIETWFGNNLKKHIKLNQLRLQKDPSGRAFIGSYWQGFIHFTWNSSGKLNIHLNNSHGFQKLNRLIYKTALHCSKRVVIPSRLKNKQIKMKIFTKGHAMMSTLPLGLKEVRNPQTGGTYWTFTHFGKIHVTTHSMIVGSRILP